MMKRVLLKFFVMIAVSIALPLIGQSQEKEMKNPLEGDPKAIEQGKQFYKFMCSTCHGLDAKGTRGPDLTSGQWTHGGTDAELLRVIMRGVPGTPMQGVAAYDLPEDDVWMIIAYLRTLTGLGNREEDRGNAQNGEAIFWEKGNCGRCHMVNGRGGRLGPDLSRIGAARSPAVLVREVRRPSEYITRGFESVTVVTQDGRRIRASLKNEDPFSVQIMDPAEQIFSFLKKDIREVVHGKESLMPEYGPDRLSDVELDDLIRYLRGLRPSAAAKN